jgi:predicted nucleotidyltransferase
MDMSINNAEINELVNAILACVPAEQIYLFGSFADGQPSAESDFDFYVVVPDDNIRPIEAMQKINSAIRPIQRRPVDLLVGNRSKFDTYKNVYSIEKQVAEKGRHLYG